MSTREPDWIDHAGMRRDLPKHALGPARLLRRLLREGLDLEAIPAALRLIAELEEIAAERQEHEDEAVAA